MKKIIFYIPSMHPSGGIERVVSTLVNKLKCFLSITILTKDTLPFFYEVNESIDKKNLNLSFNLNMNNKFIRIIQILNLNLNSIVRLKAFRKKNNFDLIYVTHPLGHLECLLAGIPPNKIVISEHGASSNYNIIYRIIKKLTYKKCKAYCIPTVSDYNYYANLDFPAIHIPHFKSELSYKKPKLKNKIILNIGRLTADKDQLTLIEIWKNIIPNIDKDWNLYIVGNGELKETLISKISEYNLSTRIKLLPPIENIEKYYEKASIFALTSKSEGFGMVLLEAISFGLPVISFDCPSGPRDIIHNDVNGYLIKPESLIDYQNKLITLINNPSILMHLSSGAIETSNNWSDDKIISLWENILK